MAPQPRLYLKLVLTMLFWGGTWIAGRIAVKEVEPLAVAVYRFLIASLGLSYLVYKSLGYLPSLNQRQLVVVILLGITGVFGYNLFFLYGLQFISAGRGALVVALNPVVAAIFAWVLFKEPMPYKKVIGIMIALIGCLFVISNGHPYALLTGQISHGEWMILGCVVCWTLYTFIGRIAKNVGLSPLVMTMYACFTGWLLLTALAFYKGSISSVPAYSLKAWASIFFLGIFGTAIAFTWFIDAVGQLGPTRASSFLNLVPVSAVLLGILFLGEHLNFVTLVGGALVLIGVFFTARPTSVQPPPTLK